MELQPLEDTTLLTQEERFRRAPQAYACSGCLAPGECTRPAGRPHSYEEQQSQGRNESHPINARTRAYAVFLENPMPIILSATPGL